MIAHAQLGVERQSGHFELLAINSTLTSFASAASIYIKGVKMFSTKTSTDVGMVPLINASSCMEKTTGGKSVGTRRGMP